MNLKNEQAEQQFAILETMSRQSSVIEAAKLKTAQKIEAKREEFEKSQLKLLSEVQSWGVESKNDLDKVIHILAEANKNSEKYKIRIFGYDKENFKKNNLLTSASS